MKIRSEAKLIKSDEGVGVVRVVGGVRGSGVGVMITWIIVKQKLE